jgi:hypothetical protein
MCQHVGWVGVAQKITPSAYHTWGYSFGTR